MTTDSLFEVDLPPERMAVIGLGPLGLEMGLALARLGVRVTGVDPSGSLGAIDDPEIAERARAHVAREIELWTGEAIHLRAAGSGIGLHTETRTAEVDCVLCATGRTPNLDTLGLDTIGVRANAHGHFRINGHTCQLEDLPIFVAGDASAHRSLLHEAQDEGAIAGFNATQVDRPVAFERKVPLAIAFTHPDIVSVGAKLSSLDPNAIVIGQASGGDNGRARIMGSLDSLVRLYADKLDGRVLGASLFGIGAEHLGHLMAFAIGSGATAQAMAYQPIYHPTLEELLKAAIKDLARQLPKKPDAPFGLRRCG